MLLTAHLYLENLHVRTVSACERKHSIYYYKYSLICLLYWSPPSIFLHTLSFHSLQLGKSLVYEYHNFLSIHLLWGSRLAPLPEQCACRTVEVPQWRACWLSILHVWTQEWGSWMVLYLYCRLWFCFWGISILISTVAEPFSPPPAWLRVPLPDVFHSCGHFLDDTPSDYREVDSQRRHI